MSAPLLAVEDLSKMFMTPGGLFAAPREARVVRGVSFELNRGETLALVGESGSGKTTIGRMLLRLIEPDGGRIALDGADVRALSPTGLRAMRRRAQIIFQDPFGSLDPRVRVGEAIAEPIRLHRLREGGAVTARVEELLTLVGLSPAQAARFPHEFSGGQRQRIAIARALAVEPDLLVCDEPVSALDLSIQAQVVNLLADLQKRLGLAYVFISHDMAVVRHLATTVAVLYAGRVVERGPAETVFGDPRHPYTRILLAATPSPVPGRRPVREPVVGEPPSPYAPDAGCAFASRCPARTEACLVAVPPLRPIFGGERQAACIHAEQLPPAALASDDEALMSDAYRRRLDLLRSRRVALASAPSGPGRD